MSPQSLEARIQSLESRGIEKWSQSPFLLWLGLIVGVLITYLAVPLWAQSMPAWSRFFMLQDRYWSTVALAAGFVLSLILSRRHTRWLYPIILLSAWIVPCLILGLGRPVIAAPPLFVALYAVILRFSRPSILHRFASAVFALVSFIGLLWVLVLDVESSRDFQVFRLFWALHLEMLVLYFASASFRQEPIPLSITLNPLQLYIPLPWPKEVRLSELGSRVAELRMSGFIHLVVSQAIFLSLLIVVPHIPEASTLTGNIIHYFTFLFFIIASMGMVTAFLRCFGYEAPPATYFLLLAKSPLEIWQRGSTYMATFLFEFVFFPIWKRSRSMWLAGSVVALSVFFHIHFFHEFFLKEILRLMAPGLGLHAPAWDQTFLAPLCWVTVWLVWIGFFYVLTKIFGFLKGGWGSWLAVMLTHLGSSQVIPVSKWLIELTR